MSVTINQVLDALERSGAVSFYTCSDDRRSDLQSFINTVSVYFKQAGRRRRVCFSVECADDDQSCGRLEVRIDDPLANEPLTRARLNKFLRSIEPFMNPGHTYEQSIRRLKNQVHWPLK